MPDKREISNASARISVLSYLADWASSSPLLQLVNSISPVAIVFGIIGLGINITTTRLQQDVWDQERLGQAWSILATKSDGNTGKLWALDYLNNRGMSLAHIDLSPASPDGRVFLDDVRLQGAALQNSDLSRVRMNRADLSFRKGTGDGKPIRTNLTLARVKSADLDSADLSGVILKKADLTGAELNNVNFLGATLNGANISRALFRNARNLTKEVLNGAWYWSSREPRGLKDDLRQFVKSCNFSLRYDYDKAVIEPFPAYARCFCVLSGSGL
jgi:uncharacterized protein YjbI with pentapeptide repeats